MDEKEKDDDRFGVNDFWNSIEQMGFSHPEEGRLPWTASRQDIARYTSHTEDEVRNFLEENVSPNFGWNVQANGSQYHFIPRS